MTAQASGDETTSLQAACRQVGSRAKLQPRANTVQVWAQENEALIASLQQRVQELVHGPH